MAPAKPPATLGGAVLNTIGPSLTNFGKWYSSTVRQQIDEFGQAVKNPGAHTLLHPDVHNPREGIPEIIAENLGGALKGTNKVTIAGVG